MIKPQGNRRLRKTTREVDTLVVISKCGTNAIGSDQIQSLGTPGKR